MGQSKRCLTLIVVAASFFGTVRCSGNHAVLIDTSRLWTNYRHSSNVLSFYTVLRDLGFPDDRISMFLNGDVACSSLNTEAGTVFHTRGHNLYSNLYSDIKGDEISRDSIARLLKGKHRPFTPRARRLMLSEESRLFVFLTGHSGIGFAKIQDLEEYSAADISATLHEMSELGRYHQMLWVADTCRAASIHNSFYSPNIMALGSSAERQSSYSRHGDNQLGVSIVDRFSYHAESFLNSTLRNRKNLSLTVNDFASLFDYNLLMSDVSLRTDFTDPHSYRLTDFLASPATVEQVRVVIRTFKVTAGSWDSSITEILNRPGGSDEFEVVRNETNSRWLKSGSVFSAILFLVLVTYSFY
jgi:phosphatidylinositol glycan class K